MEGQEGPIQEVFQANHWEDVNLGQNPERPEGALLGEVGEDEGPFLGHQLVLLHPKLL